MHVHVQSVCNGSWWKLPLCSPLGLITESPALHAPTTSHSDTPTLAAVVRNVRAEQLSTTAVRVSWDGIDVPEITGYIVYSQIVNIAETEEYRRVPSTEQSVDILGIKSIVPYQFTVAATAQFYEGRVTIGHRSLVDDQSVITISVLTKGGKKQWNLKKKGTCEVLILAHMYCSIKWLIHSTRSGP